MDLLCHTCNARFNCNLDGVDINDTCQNYAPYNINDSVNHPKHYTSHPSGIECIEITRHYVFTIGNAIKYLWRAGLKSDAALTDIDKEIEDLEKAIWYINDRIKTLKNDRNR